MSERVSKDAMACNKPRRTPGHPKKSHVVKACFDGKEKIIRFGEQGASTAGKPKEGESERMKTKRASFKARHSKNIAKGPSSAAYWANKVKWAEGGEVKMAAGGSAALALIEQMRRSGSRSQEFDPILASTREQRARAARRPAAPRMPQAQAEEPLPLPPVPPSMRPDEAPPPEAPRNAMRFDEGNPHVATAIRMAERYGLPTNVFLSLVQQESGFNPAAVSRRGAIGLGQLMPGTAQELRVNPHDPEQNLEGSARYLRQMLDRFGDMSLALAAYNAGPRRVIEAGNTIPNIRETQNYVPSILRRAGANVPGQPGQGYAEGGEVSEPRGALSRFGNYLYNAFIRPNDMGMAANERALSEGIPGGAGGPRDAIRHMVASSYTTPLGVTASELLNGDMLNSLVGDNQATWDRANNALGQRLRSVPEGERYDRAKDMVLQQLRHLVEYGEMSGSLPSFDPRFTVVDRDAEGREIVYGPREIIGWIESGRMPRLSDDSRVLRSDIYTSGSIGDRLRPASRRDRAPTSVPATPNKFAEGGLADLEQKYAEGGPVITPYDPEEVEALAGSVEQPEGYAEGGRVGRVAGAIRRAVTRESGEAAERALPPVENSRLTQVATTGGTYEKARDVLRERGVEGPVLDYGAGRGHGSAILGGDSFEPYPGAGFRPTYTDPSEIPADRYAGLVNLNVLNVLPPEVRDEAVRNMGRVLEPQGTAVITTRGRDVMSARGTPGPEPMSLVIGEGDRARYQKGFTPTELREYLQRVLGPRFDVENLDLGPAGALVRRLYGVAPAALLLPENESDRGLADLADKYAEGGAVMSDEEYDRRLLSRMKEQTGRVTEPTPAEQMQALRTAGRSAAEGVADVLLPQSPLDVALMVALGPGGRAARLAGAGALAALEPSDAEASRLRRLIRAYHGSPHKFDEFDIRKIGTGEGAQAYGRGLYFAENEDIAKYYRDSLSGGPLTTDFSIGARVPMITRGNVVDYSPRAFDPQSIAKAELQEQLLMLEPDLRTMADDVQRAAAVRRTIVDMASDPGADPQAMQYYNSVLRGLDEGSTPLRYRWEQPGHMYEVDLNASPRDFLNWDAPLSQQSPEVRESLQRFGLRADPDAARAYDDALLDALYNDASRPLPPLPRDPTGQEIYERALRMDPEEARIALMEVGIPGTRYLDAGSRGVGGSTYNYAVFDPEIIDIRRRYAQGGLAQLENKYAEGGEVSAMTYDPAAVDALAQQIEAEYV